MLPGTAVGVKTTVREAYARFFHRLQLSFRFRDLMESENRDVRDVFASLYCTVRKKIGHELRT